MSPEWAIDACLSCHIPEEAWPAYLELLAASGVRTLRERGIGTREADGRYRGDMRPAYRRLKAAGHQVVAFAGTPVPVVQVGNVLPEDLLVVYAHAQHLGRDFAGLVDAWEMVGEPDVGYCPDLPDRVAAYQKALYLGIKAGARSVGAPAPAVLMGALALPPGPWLERAVRNGLLDYTDAYNFHYYGHPEDLPGVIAAHARVAARGKVVNEVPVFPKAWWQRSSAPQTTDLPLWITECGIEVASAQDFLNPQRRRMQAEYTQKTAQVAWGDRRVALFMPFILAHEKDPHALTLPGAVPLPAWTTYAEFTRRPPWPARRLVNPPPAPNPLVVQWLPDNRTTRPHKVSGTYRMVGDLTVTGELRFYNFSARAITGRVVETALRRIQREGRLPETLTVPPGEMRAVPVSFKKMAPTGYVREDWTVTFAELGGALTAVSFALETEPVSGDFEKRPWPVLPPIGDTLKHPVDAWDDIGSISGRWRGLNQLRVEEVAGDTIRVSTRQLTGDPLRGRQALARVGPLPANGFIRLELVIGATGEAVHSDEVSGGAVGLHWREPLGHDLIVDGAIGLALATERGATAATLTNPRVAVTWRRDRATGFGLALTLPAASRTGTSGQVAAAMAAAHRVDPSPWLAGATTLAASAARTWRRPLGELTVTAAAAWLARTEARDLPLVHLDAAGAIAAASRLELTATFATTSYLLVADRTDAFVHTLALGARYRDRRLTIAAAAVAPVDAAERAIDTVGATLAITVALP
jgi:hypothetical protein